MTRTPTLLLSAALAFATATLASAERAEARQHRYAGIHPVAEGVFCYIEFPHVHVVAPVKQEVLYREHDDAAFFVGDPVAYGYDGPKHAYYGHHPVPVDVILDEHELDGDEVEYCYLDGPHYHHFAAPPDIKFVVKGGVHYYAGEFPTAYVEAKPRFARINAVYKPIVYTRPVVVEAPPPEYHGPVVEVRVEPAVVVEPAPVVVTPVAPVVEGHVVAPGVHGHLEVGVALPHVEVVVPGVTIVEEHHVYEHKHKHRKHKHWKHKGKHRGKHKGRW